MGVVLRVYGFREGAGRGGEGGREGEGEGMDGRGYRIDGMNRNGMQYGIGYKCDKI